MHEDEIRLVIGEEESTPEEAMQVIRDLLSRSDEDFAAVRIEPLDREQHEANEALRKALSGGE